MARRKKSYQKAKVAYWITGIAAFIFVAYIGFLIWSTRDPEVVDYTAFGIPVPLNYQIHGIDVSRYQERISWDAVSDMKVGTVKIGFAFIKATEGEDDKDPFFKRNWEKAKEAGLVRGAYHYFIAKKDPFKQVKNFVKNVQLEPGDLPPVLDIEDSYGMSQKKLIPQVKKWLLAMEVMYKVKPIIYTYVDFYEKHLKDTFDTYPLWIAHYFEEEHPRIERPWTFWQHNDRGRVNGILTRVDFNVFNGDTMAFRSLLVP